MDGLARAIPFYLPTSNHMANLPILLQEAVFRLKKAPILNALSDGFFHLRTILGVDGP